MPLNASIFGNLLNAPKSPEEYALERQQAESGALTNALNRQKVDEYTKGIERQNQLRTLLSGGADSSALRQAGFLDEASNLDKSAAAVAKDRSSADESAFKLASQRYDVYRKTAASRYNDPNLSKQSVIGDIQQMKAMGVLTPELADHLASQLPDDPVQLREVVKSAAMSQLNGEQLLTAFAPKPEKFDSGGQIIARDMNPNSPTYGQNTGGAPIVKVQSPDSRASIAATIRGQDKADARAREATQATMSKPFEVTGTDGQPVLVQQDKQGNIRPVQGYGPKPTAPSAAQQKELMSINQQRSIINGALQAVDTTPGAFTFKRGIAGKMPFGETMAGRMETPEETQARSYVFNNVSRVINERAGAAQSAQELARLNSFLPADTDGPEQIKNKLRGFAKYLDDLESGTRGAPKQAALSNTQRTVTRTGTHNGKKVIQYSDGSIEYAN
jgi:hypothetical protein